MTGKIPQPRETQMPCVGCERYEGVVADWRRATGRAEDLITGEPVPQDVIDASERLARFLKAAEKCPVRPFVGLQQVLGELCDYSTETTIGSLECGVGLSACSQPAEHTADIDLARELKLEEV